MRKVSRADDLSPLAEHRLRVGARQSAGLQGGTAVRPNQSSAETRLWVPLVGFEWRGREYKVDSSTRIRIGSQFLGYGAKDVVKFISAEEKDRCRETRHWLFFSRRAHAPFSAASHVNAFLLALWIVRPTPTHAAIRFERSPDGEYHAVRLLDRFQWIPDYVSSDVGTEHLSRASDLFTHIRDAYVKGGRLRNALVLAYRGCVSKEWQPAALSFGAALATLLRNSPNKPVLDDLSVTLARLRVTADELDPETVRDTYRTALNIMEGDCEERGAADDNLAKLAQLSQALRTVLSASLSAEARIASGRS